MKKEIYGLSRGRDKKGDIIKRDYKPYVNCIHTMVGAGYETMQVLVMEVYEDDNSRRLQPEHPEGAGCDSDKTPSRMEQRRII